MENINYDLEQPKWLDSIISMEIEQMESYKEAGYSIVKRDRPYNPKEFIYLDINLHDNLIGTLSLLPTTFADRDKCIKAVVDKFEQLSKYVRR
jgi:hypothetical protein